MTGGQEKKFSTLGPKLRENRARQYYGDKSLQIRVETTNYSQVYQSMAKAMDPHMLRAIGGMRGIEDMMKQMQQGGDIPGGMGMQGLEKMMKKKGGKK